MRDHLVSQKVSLEHHIAGVFKTFGVVAERGNVTAEVFCKRTLESLSEAERNSVQVRSHVLLSPFLHVEACEKIAPLTEKIHSIAVGIEMVRRFMDIPGIGRQPRYPSTPRSTIRNASRNPRTRPPIFELTPR